MYDADLDKKIAAELEKIVQLDEEIEFWFYDPDGYSYEKLGLFLAIWLRTKYPNKSIKIIRVFFKETEGTIDYVENIDRPFPRCIVDKNLHMPNNYDWLSKQCDYLFFYDYPEMHKEKYGPPALKKDATIIHLAYAETKDRIQDVRASLSEQEQRILQMLEAGKTQISIAQTVGLSKNSIRLKIRDIYHKIRIQMKHATAIDPPFRQGVCALMNLDNPLATSTQLTLFGCMLEFLIQCNINEFWIDEASLRTSYGVILVRAIRYKKRTPKDVELKLKIFPNTLQGYKEAIQQSQWVLTDYAHSQAETIKTLCSEDGRTLLVDLVSDKRTIEKMSF